MSYLDSIEEKLKARFSPSFLKVVDESAQHAGHAGARPGGETHFRVVMRAREFSAMSRLERGRAVYAALADELASQIHALALDLEGDDEATGDDGAR